MGREALFLRTKHIPFMKAVGRKLLLCTISELLGYWSVECSHRGIRQHRHSPSNLHENIASNEISNEEKLKATQGFLGQPG
jgi:hypothetical protein